MKRPERYNLYSPGQGIIEMNVCYDFVEFIPVTSFFSSQWNGSN